MSKILLIVSDILAVGTTIFTFIAVFLMSDTSPLIYLSPGVFGLASVAHGFYFWKAKNENLHKYGQDSKIRADSSGAGFQIEDIDVEEDPSGSDDSRAVG